ncbi:hypothetical protein TNIN_413381 [Trichonephila inaurata madagascariensis]|uniref:Uncharacterized protein n=1 Tax=Trichonephila inaurata madagascariensis TaxID=2747483 RepID=A0A8X6YR59_9ARAC|nr:hypothetical protein TNIN_413381 [Trichonephila inaurata madagascariensis]
MKFSAGTKPDSSPNENLATYKPIPVDDVGEGIVCVHHSFQIYMHLESVVNQLLLSIKSTLRIPDLVFWKLSPVNKS